MLHSLIFWFSEFIFSAVIYCFRIEVMMCKSVPCESFPLCAGNAVIAVGINRYTAAREKFSPDLDIFRLHKPDEILHYDVHAVLVEIAVIAEAEQIKFQRFALDHFFSRNIGNIYRSEVRLTCYRAKTCELRTVELYEIIVIRVLVWKGLKNSRIVVEAVFGILVAEQGNAAFFVVGSSGHVILLSQVLDLRCH